MMKEFWKDYGESCKVTGQFYKKHWLGMIVLNVVTTAGIFAYYGRDQIKDSIKEKFHKEEIEELD